jgi:hypothetical protein
MDRGSDGCNEYYGFGIVQVKAAYDLLSTDGCTAGGVDPGVLSNGAIGGCEQDPDYVPPPTAAPTPFQCDKTTISIQLRTDDYGGETLWELTNSAGNGQASGSGYSSNTNYVDNQCVSANTCTFTIKDSYGDGMCFTRNGVTFDRGGLFDGTETINICEGSTTPSLTPTSLPSSTPSLHPSFSNTPTLVHSSVSTMFPSSRPSLRPTAMPVAKPAAMQEEEQEMQEALRLLQQQEVQNKYKK